MGTRRGIGTMEICYVGSGPPAHAIYSWLLALLKTYPGEITSIVTWILAASTWSYASQVLKASSSLLEARFVQSHVVSWSGAHSLKGPSRMSYTDFQIESSSLLWQDGIYSERTSLFHVPFDLLPLIPCQSYSHVVNPHFLVVSLARTDCH